MKKRRLVVALVAAVLLVAAVVALAVLRPWNWGGRGRRDPARVPSDAATFDPPRRQPLLFADACAPIEGQLVVIGAIGDALLHNRPHRQGLKLGFASLWEPMAALLKAADVTYANFEGTLAMPGGLLPGGRSNDGNRLIYHPRFARALKEAGVDVVSTANNHAADGWADGVVSTLDGLDAAGLAHTGTRRNDDEPWSTVTAAGGMHIAWVACTEWTNVPDTHGRILGCHRDRDEVMGLVRQLAHTPGIDAVIVTPHGGAEGLPRADRLTRQLHRDFVEAGAIAVLANHPHQVEQWEKVQAKDGHEALVSPCTGASFTGVPGKQQRAGAMLFLGLARGRDGKVTLRGVRHVPLAYSQRSGRYVMEPAASAADMEGIRRRVLAQLSSWNEAAPTPPIDVVPQCRADFQAPVVVLGQAGDACDTADQCAAGLACRLQLNDGRCQ